ncbi:MAG: PD-(D/E)XK nuclease family protein, partial [Alphaproteobacteria bacterium]|nr:PD-(D/E)XK nuclease family protein [Alphaproteobacteria bacterium]
HLVNALEDAMGALKALIIDDLPRPLPEFVTAHIRAAEEIAVTNAAANNPDTMSGAARVWAGDDGTAGAQLMASLLEHGALMVPLTGTQYIQMLEGLMAGVSVRTPTGLHPRIFILGQLEARLVQADLTIMAGLNEGTWPPDAGHDPFLSRTMRRQAGLPTPERSMGLSAHDFVQGFCAPRIIMTRARRVDGAQTVPARWLQRLDTVLRAVQIDPALLQERAPGTPPYAALARAVDVNAHMHPQERPAPTPPLDLRPRSLSVTEIETWLRDPYSIYAKHVLKLRKLDDLEKEPDAAARGTLLHDALSDFVAQNQDTLPPHAAQQLYDRGVHAVSARADDPGFWEFWMPRYASLCHWFIGHEAAWRKDRNRPAALECKGQMTLPGPAGPFALRVRADRIDRRADGTMAIIDYKSGGADKYSKGKILSGHWPQLPLTALILQQGGIENVPPSTTGYLGYWVLTGGTPPGVIKSLEDDIDTALTVAAEGLAALIAAFDRPEQPYFALPRPDHLPTFNDYDHLARVQEWTALGENQTEDAA